MSDLCFIMSNIGIGVSLWQRGHYHYELDNNGTIEIIMGSCEDAIEHYNAIINKGDIWQMQPLPLLK